jgi:hypothetical protein
MADLNAIEQLVVSDYTRRPEISSVTRAAVRTAVLRAHHVDFFPRDLSQYTLTYTPTSGAISQDFASLSASVPRLRTLKTLTCIDPVTNAPVENLEFREIDDVYDSDGLLRPSIYSLIGDTLRIYPQRFTGAVTLYYYQNPAIVGDVVSSWIADTYTDEIAAWAAAIVFNRTGFAEQAKMINDANIVPFKESLISSHLLGNVS